MRRAFLYTRRAVAVVFVLLVIWVIASVAYAGVHNPLGGTVLLVILALLGGVLFLLWAVYRFVRGTVRFLVRPARPRTSGLGSDYEQLVRATQSRRGRRRRG